MYMHNMYMYMYMYMNVHVEGDRRLFSTEHRVWKASTFRSLYLADMALS